MAHAPPGNPASYPAKKIDRGNRDLITKAASAYVIMLRVTVGERVVKNEGIDSQI